MDIFIKTLKSLFNDELSIKKISLIKSVIATIIYLLVPYSINFMFVWILGILKKDVSFGLSLVSITIVTCIGTMCVLIISSKVFSYKEGSNTKEKYITIRKRDILYVFFIMIGFILIRQGLLFDVLTKFKGPVTKENIDFICNNLEKTQLSFTIFILMIQTIIIAPIFEELFFRGIIFNGLLNKYQGDFKKAIIFSSIIFGVAHLNIPQGINGIIAGTILAAIYYYTKSIKLSIFAHFLNNFFVFLPVPNTIFMKIIYIIIGICLVNRGMELFKLRVKSNKY
ncbi:lysostaphin resistance A-like protein [Romboutsia sp.]|uniref:CPBP family intramembrane glutamic endopeptidase n=1 Tax=Romboutsia sp. TaxID=1965302 RepID=UPI003F315692